MENKELLEVENLKLDIKHKKSQVVFDKIKSIVTVLGAVVVFLWITIPEFLNNKRFSEEAISRERAKLLIEILKEHDPVLRKQGLTIIKNTYPSNNKWIKDIEKELFEKVNLDIETAKEEDYLNLLKRRESFLQQLNQVHAGSPEAKTIEIKLKAIENKISQFK
jgi:hypothetical protein